MNNIIDGTTIEGSNLRKRYERLAHGSAYEIAPVYEGAGRLSDALAEVIANGYKVISYGGWSYVLIGRRWYRINKVRQARTKAVRA